MATALPKGVYGNEYFSGAQVSLYIGDVWIDEVTSLSIALQEPREPLYGYADKRFRDMSEGQIIVHGQFSINFKEAGYLFVVLDRFHKMNGKVSVLEQVAKEYENGNIGLGGAYGNTKDGKIVQALTVSKKDQQDAAEELAKIYTDTLKQRLLTGNTKVIPNTRDLKDADETYKAFTSQFWQEELSEEIEELKVDRRPTNRKMNNFDMYVYFGDYKPASAQHAHTVQRVDSVYLTGQYKQIVINGEPIQEVYQFIARDLV